LTSVILPFTKSAHNSPALPDNVIDIVKMAQPQVLILPAGRAMEDLKKVKSIKAIVVVDISSAPHMDWSSEDGGVPVKTWSQILDIEAHHEPSEAAPIAIQSFFNTKGEFKSVDFTHQVILSFTGPYFRMSSQQLLVK
jgi:hypothetical protein